MERIEEVELTNMCMLCDGKGNVLVQNKVNHAAWHGWSFPGGHVEKGEYVTPSVIREMQEETGLTIVEPRLCGIKEFHRLQDEKRYIVFLYIATVLEKCCSCLQIIMSAKSFTKEPLMILRRFIVKGKWRLRSLIICKLADIWVLK